MRKSEEGEPISRHMGFPATISSNYNYPTKTTGKEQETTKMTLHKIDDEYKLEYHFIRYDGSLGVMYQTIQTLYCIPVFFDTLAKAGGRILIKSCVKVSE